MTGGVSSWRTTSIAPTVDVDLLRAMRELPVTQQVAVVLFYFEDRPIAEIVHILGIGEGSVKVHLHRARERLAGVLGEEVGEDAR